MHLDVLHLSMEDEVLSKMDNVEIVTVDQDWVIDGDIHIFQNMLKSYNFTCCTIAPLYLASVLDSVTVGCFLLLHEMAPLLREKTNPEVECQLASVCPLSRIDTCVL